MKISRRAITLGGLGILATGGTPAQAWDYDLIEGDEGFCVTKEAYLYGYPLVMMEMTRRVATSVILVEGSRGPMGLRRRGRYVRLRLFHADNTYEALQ